MTPEKFISLIQTAVVDQNTNIYKDLLESTSPERVSDAYWKRVIKLHHSLNEADRGVLLDIMRQVTIDTVSNLFAILDGVNALDESKEDFVLTSFSDNRKLNGNLQDLFLSAE